MAKILLMGLFAISLFIMSGCGDEDRWRDERWDIDRHEERFQDRDSMRQEEHHEEHEEHEHR